MSGAVSSIMKRCGVPGIAFLTISLHILGLSQSITWGKAPPKGINRPC